MPSISRRTVRATRPTRERSENSDDSSDEETSELAPSNFSFFPSGPVVAGSPNDLPPPPSGAVPLDQTQLEGGRGKGEEEEEEEEEEEIVPARVDKGKGRAIEVEDEKEGEERPEITVPDIPFGCGGSLGSRMAFPQGHAEAETSAGRAPKLEEEIPSVTQSPAPAPATPFILNAFLPGEVFFTYQHGRYNGEYWLERTTPVITCAVSHKLIYDRHAWYSEWMEIDEETVGLSGIKYEWELIA